MRITAKLGEFLWRPLTVSDADTDFVLSLRSNPRFAPWFYAPPPTREQHSAFLESPARAEELLWVVERSGRPVGTFSIYHIDRANRRVECGRIASLVPRMFPLNFTVGCTVIFEHLKMNKAWIETLDGNTIIARGVERLGMKREGVLRDHVRRDGEYLTVLYYGILAADWFGGERERQYARYGVPEVIAIER